MNTAYVYLQLYRLFDTVTPIPADCGKLCANACCKGTENGMYLFPGEQKVYELLNPSWITIERSNFTYNYDGKTYHVPLALCNGHCDRYQRPLACRIFPLTPYLDQKNQLSVLIDPRSKAVCPLAKALSVKELDPLFVQNVEKTFRLLCKNKQVFAFLKEYSNYLDGFRKFFNE